MGNQKRQKRKAKNKFLQQDLKFLLLKKRPTKSVIFEVFAIYGVYIMALVSAAVILGGLGYINTDQVQDLGVDRPETSTAIFAVFLLFVVLPPVVEEILFRGFLYNKLVQYAGIGVAYVLTSLLFGAAHLEFGNLNWLAALDTLIFSGFLIYISQKHQSLYSAMLLHAMKNSLAFFMFVR